MYIYYIMVQGGGSEIDIFIYILCFFYHTNKLLKSSINDFFL